MRFCFFTAHCCPWLTGHGLIELPSLPEWSVLGVERLFPNRLLLLLSGTEHTLFAATDSFVGMKSFEDKLCRGDLLLSAFLRRNSERTELLDQALNSAQLFQRFRSGNRVRHLNLAAQIEPLHDLLHIGAGVVFVVGFGDGSANQFAANKIRALHLAFIFEFEFSGNRRQSGVDVADARYDEFLLISNRASLGIGDHVLHRRDGQALADARALVDLLIFASRESDALNNLLHVAR